MIAIVKYGLGNTQAFVNIYKRLDFPITVAVTPDDLDGAKKIILPGVGAFDWAMTRLNASGMRAALDEAVLGKRIPVLGICVGMQMMARGSEEGELAGLGWIDAEVVRFSEELGVRSEEGRQDRVQLPHMGWNDVRPVGGNGLFKELGEEARFYFLHSYYFMPGDAGQVVGVTDYLGEYASAVCSENVYGVQFHPEKSHGWGIRLLKNFAEL